MRFGVAQRQTKFELAGNGPEAQAVAAADNKEISPASQFCSVFS